ncbi:citrulline utilization hydrolase CtlX [Mucilaginibacter myungsuensis]|uniref:Amidinotransferase n=1 Tax=Mucilaginibacter myungsuensis TaxID=649104 RepID=A0A929KZJ7_9SPHI|nr:arginine deiminase-related protein [Mucilaginibacter myungsuensis]MBE9664601.1 amidinotransferase [Mucilaginibacter myungsuensis]MDN3601049.1 arginine deiminase-related protein [Mucilaginibacter myungsuensis]
MQPSTILMIRPVNFGYNEQTAESNAFQRKDAATDVQQNALAEFDNFVEKLRAEGINVIVMDDTPSPHTPDSIFPNNWISFHEDGSIFIYPMQAPNRRDERRTKDVINILADRYEIDNIEDLTKFEDQDLFLEGTGSMVFDRLNKIAYACLSPRTDQIVVDEFCRRSGYSAVTFNSFDEQGTRIYHTNVLMCIAESFAVICLDTITDEQQRKAVSTKLQQSGKEVIEISQAQLRFFAGNMLELTNKDGKKVLIMSEQAYSSLNNDQINTLQRYAKIVHSSLQTIEINGGGSARCMMAEICLPAI